jgi:hypothetical protein
MQIARRVWKGGTPLSWPGAWAFALRTGAPPERYDTVVGSFFLTDFMTEQYRKKADKKTDALKFADGHDRFLVRGFGAPLAREKRKLRHAGGTARVLVPFNHAGAVKMQLLGEALADVTVRVRWNGDEVASAPYTAGAPIDLTFELSASQIERGVNILELVHDTGGEPAAYERLAMWQL